MRVLHLINDLHGAGTELALLRLLGEERRWGWETTVLSLADGRVRGEMEGLGVRVISLGMYTDAPSTAHLRYLVQALKILPLVRRLRPQLLQGWMYHTNLAASIAALCGTARAPVLWNIRQSLDHIRCMRHTTAATIRMGKLLSQQPLAIVYNSETAVQQHEAFGYSPRRRIVLSGGFDMTRFRPAQESGRRIRRELGLNNDAILVGLIARYHPMKDHGTFLRAAGLVAKKHPEARFLLAGRAVASNTPGLAQALREQDLQGRAFLLGERIDMPEINAALDIACSSSQYGEGFSNAVGEAMACGVPCVVTDVGDSARIVGTTGLVTSPGDALALADAIGQLIEGGPTLRRRLGDAARQRIENEFSLKAVSQRYRELCETLTLRNCAP
jgi:glycosyltransferase involved in cell wall biosynthesis